MESDWERRTPRPEVAAEDVARWLAEAGWARAPRCVERLPGGLVNAHLRLAFDAPPDTAVLRLCLRDARAADVEAALLARLPAGVPAPRLLARGRAVLREPVAREVPWLLLTDLPGRPLAEVEAALAPAAARRAGRDLGTALARLHAEARADLGFLDADLRVTEPLGGLRATWLAYLRETLGGPRAAPRLGPQRRDALLALAEAQVGRLAPLEGRYALLHADCKPTNVLVDERGALTGLLDWEFAWSGPPLFDLGQLRRRPLRPELEEGLVAGYLAAGGDLPPGWRAAARLLDLMNLAGFLDQPEPRPAQTRDVLGLLDDQLADQSWSRTGE